ncbi:MAG: RNA methyltransferase [Alphaproteobacteria bacterium]|nr:RNA methyltransferase [Alphaproteobacteria bacterium]
MKNPKKPTHTPKDSHYAKLRRAHRDAKAVQETTGAEPGNKQHAGLLDPNRSVLLYGLHPVRAALDNPDRKIRKMWITKNALNRIGVSDPASLAFEVDLVTPQAIDKLLPGDAIHQGVLIDAAPLPIKPLDSLTDSPIVLVLDQVTDPHNVGAIMRSAVAFGAGAIVTTLRNSPSESGVLAKSASGALELIPYIQVTNLADAIETLNGIGFETVGLDSEGPKKLEETLSGQRIALVLGAEGKGLRQKTRATVKALARLDMPGAIKSLNVSNAAAISLYAAHAHLTD